MNRIVLTLAVVGLVSSLSFLAVDQSAQAANANGLVKAASLNEIVGGATGLDGGPCNPSGVQCDWAPPCMTNQQETESFRGFKNPGATPYTGTGGVIISKWCTIQKVYGLPFCSGYPSEVNTNYSKFCDEI
jgi:hypothetical protein